MSSRILLLAGLVLSVIPFLGRAQEIDTIVFAEPFAYSAWSSGADPMNAVWTKNTGSKPTVATGTPFLPEASFLKLNNTVAFATLDRPLTHGFELSFDALHTNYSRRLWVGLFDETGTRGYVASWDSSLAANYGSQGIVHIRKFAVAGPGDILFDTNGTILGPTVGSGHNPGNTLNAATSAPFARIRLAWDKDTGALTLHVNGVLRQTVTDTGLSAFAKVFVSGGSGSMIDNILVREPVGAVMPFVTHEAENAIVHGGTVEIFSGLPGSTTHTAALEASGRAYVRLGQTGDSLTIPVHQPADRLVLRHSIPDAPQGGGIEATLNLYVNGLYRQTITLSSARNWLYGDPSKNGQSNDPAAGPAHVFWDESRHVIEGGLNPGDTLGLHKDAANTAAYYSIDLLDLEQAPAPLSPPSNHVNVMDHGAVGDGLTDDTDAIETAISVAKAGGKTVWLPAGIYLQSRRLTLNSVSLRGAGMWHTSIIGIVHGDTWGGNMGFHLTGNGPEISDLYLESAVHASRTTGGKAVTGGATNWRAERLWITHTMTGLWMSGATHGIVRDCRVRFTYADGINLNRGASFNLAENNHVRGCGDDGIAILSEIREKPEHAEIPVSVGNILRGNTVTATWWGHNIDLAGGFDHLVENNYLADNSRMAVFTVNLPGAYRMQPLSDSVVRRNLMIRGGGNAYGQQRGAIWIYPGTTTITDVEISENLIVAPIFRGIHLAGGMPQNIEFTRNTIVAPGRDAIFIQDTVKGAGVFRHNTVDALNPGYSAFKNQAVPANYIVTDDGTNSW